MNKDVIEKLDTTILNWIDLSNGGEMEKSELCSFADGKCSECPIEQMSKSIGYNEGCSYQIKDFEKHLKSHVEYLDSMFSIKCSECKKHAGKVLEMLIAAKFKLIKQYTDNANILYAVENFNKNLSL